jgi:hypothetical protein
VRPNGALRDEKFSVAKNQPGGDLDGRRHYDYGCDGA